MQMAARKPSTREPESDRGQGQVGEYEWRGEEGGGTAGEAAAWGASSHTGTSDLCSPSGKPFPLELQVSRLHNQAATSFSI